MKKLITSEKECKKLDISRIENLAKKFFKPNIDKNLFFEKVYSNYNKTYSPVMSPDDYSTALKNLSKKMNNSELMKYRI